MADGSHAVEANATDTDAVLDRLVEESLAASGRRKAAAMTYAAPNTAEEFLSDAVTFLRHRPDQDDLLARLAEMCRTQAAKPPPAAEPPAPPADQDEG